MKCHTWKTHTNVRNTITVNQLKYIYVQNIRLSSTSLLNHEIPSEMDFVLQPCPGDNPPDYRLKISLKALNFIPWIIDCTMGEFQWSVANLHNALGGCKQRGKNNSRHFPKQVRHLPSTRRITCFSKFLCLRWFRLWKVLLLTVDMWEWGWGLPLTLNRGLHSLSSQPVTVLVWRQVKYHYLHARVMLLMC